MARRIVLVLALALAWIGAAGVGVAWNDLGHRLTIEKAIDALPKPIKKFYEQHESFLLENVRDPARVEPRLLFEVDRLEEFPFDGVPETRQGAIAKYGEEKIEEAGDLPWRLIETYEKLIVAYQDMDVPAIQSLSAEIAYYVGELWVPVNVSKYGDGEPIDQEGLRERFDSRLLEVYGEKLKVETPSAVYLDRPGEYAVSIPRKSYVWVDNILLSDYIAHRGVMSYDRFYYEGLWLRASLIISQMLESLSQDISSYWYTAWIKAGKPELPKK